MNKVIFTRGIQGSGKSTFAKKWVNEDPQHRIRINWDDMRNMFGPYWVPERESLLSAASGSILKHALDKGFDVVIDNMNLSERSKSPFMQVIDESKVTIEYVDFKTPLEECIERDSKRENPIGEKIIRSTYERNKDFYNS